VAQHRIACNLNVFTPTERPRHQALIALLKAAIAEQTELPDGYGFRLSRETISLEQPAEWAALESKCCPFFDFQLELGPQPKADLWLRLRGGDRVKEFIHFEVAPSARACDEPAAKTFGQLTVQEVSALLARGAAVVFDANGRGEWARRHVPGAKWVDFSALAERDLPASKDRLLVFYCYNKMCLASHAAARRGIEMGYTSVFIMPEGIQGWVKAGKAIEKGGGEG
jgi:rhodanese-related sulfurtransferase